MQIAYQEDSYLEELLLILNAAVHYYAKQTSGTSALFRSIPYYSVKSRVPIQHALHAHDD